MLSASETQANAGNPYTDLHYLWSCNGQFQTGPEAAFLLRDAGQFPITLTVQGRNERGQMVEASTSTLRTIGSHYLFRANATGGTFMLTFNGEVTQPIPFNADAKAIRDALHSLAALDPLNCSVGFNGNVEFNGSLAGTQYTFSGDFSGLTGTNGTPQIRTDLPSAVYDQVTVITGGWAEQYFDSSYAGPSDGTQEKPFNTWTQLAAFVGANQQTLNRVAYLKRGSVFTMAGAVSYRIGNRGLRLLAYGEGEKPVIRATESGHTWSWEQNWGSVRNPDRRGGDFVFSDMRFERSAAGAMFVTSGSNNDNPAFPYAMFSDLVWDHCDYQQTATSGAVGGFASLQTVTGRGTGLSGIHFVGCDLDMGLTAKQALFVSANQWFSLVGGSIRGGKGSLVMDHHIYSDVKGHQLYRDVVFGAGEKSFALNLNANNNAGPVPYCLVDGCQIIGTQNGIDLSNSANDRTLPGMFEDVVIQFCTIRPGDVGTQKLGVYGANHGTVSIRHCDILDCTGGAVRLSDPRLRLSLFGCRIVNGAVSGVDGQSLYMRDNQFESTGSIPLLNIGAGAVTIDSDRNGFTATAAPFQIAKKDVSFAQWQAAGKDLKSIYNGVAPPVEPPVENVIAVKESEIKALIIAVEGVLAVLKRIAGSN